MLNNDYSKCKVHGTWMKYTEAERGKTLYICESCERERWDKMKDIFVNHDIA